MANAHRIVDRYLLDSLPVRWAHVRGVYGQAKAAAPMLSKHEQELLLASALLHDVGYSDELAETGFHPLDGARSLRRFGAPDRLCALVAHHSCAVEEAKLRGLSTEIIAWSDEQTVLRDALWWADMTTTPDGKVTDVRRRIAEIKQRYGPDDVVTVFIRQAESELVAAVERTEERLRAAGLGHLAK